MLNKLSLVAFSYDVAMSREGVVLDWLSKRNLYKAVGIDPVTLEPHYLHNRRECGRQIPRQRHGSSVSHSR